MRKIIPIITMGVLASTFLNQHTFVKAEEVSNENNIVKIEKVKNVVSNFTYGEELIPDIDKDQLKNYRKVLDFEGNLMGYAFDFTQNNKEYYVFASNNYELDPIISFGEGKFIDKSEVSSSREEVYFDGGFRINNEEDYQELVFDNPIEELNTLSSKSNFKKTGDYNFLQYDTSNKIEWDQLKNNKKNKGSVLKSTMSILPDSHTVPVTRYYQRTSGITLAASACGPTTGAMFAQYLKVAKGYDVKGLSNYSSLATYVNHMARHMGTTRAGTLPISFASGLNKHLEENYSWANNAWSVEVDPAYGKFDEYKTEIGKYKFPVALYFQKNPHDYTAYSYHFVLGVGYKYSSGSAYFGVKNPDGGPDNTTTRWFKWNDNNNDMWMIRAFYLN